MRKIQRKMSKRYLIGLAVVFLLFLMYGAHVQTHITVEYAADPTGDTYASVRRDGKPLDEYQVQDNRAELYLRGTDFEELMPVHYRSWKEIVISRISFRIYGWKVMELNPQQIGQFFSYNEDISGIYAGSAKLKVSVCGDHPAFLPSEELLTKLSHAAIYGSVLNLIFLTGLYTIAYSYFFRVIDLRGKNGRRDLWEAVLGAAAIAALLLSWNIAFSSAYGGTIHPDEVQTRAAVDYYRTHWIQPDVRSDFVAQTVSGYGMTRLSENNLYYLFAGKLAGMIDIKYSFRAMGMVMFLVLVGFVLKNMKKERYLAVLLFATPQLWYLFSYATSDAWDYLVSVLAIYEVLGKNSALNRIFRERFSVRRIPAYLGTGFLFANLLMAKKTFYLVLLLIFLLLLYRLVFAQKENRKKLFLNYMGLLAVAFAIVLLRSVPDFGYYGIHKADAVAEVIENTALLEYKPSTPAVEQAKSTLLYEKGVSLKQFFGEWKFNETLFHNYFGCYGIYSLKAKEWYYAVMGGLYLALFAAVAVCFQRSCRRETANGNITAVRRMRLTYWTTWGLTALMYLMTVYNAYFVDFQPQGRYLFPALPALACQMALDREMMENKAVRLLLLLIALLSLYSFYKIAYLNF